VCAPALIAGSRALQANPASEAGPTHVASLNPLRAPST
jgi:hypothetical protein